MDILAGSAMAVYSRFRPIAATMSRHIGTSLEMRAASAVGGLATTSKPPRCKARVFPVGPRWPASRQTASRCHHGGNRAGPASITMVLSHEVVETGFLNRRPCLVGRATASHW